MLEHKNEHKPLSSSASGSEDPSVVRSHPFPLLPLFPLVPYPFYDQQTGQIVMVPMPYPLGFPAPPQIGGDNASSERKASAPERKSKRSKKRKAHVSDSDSEYEAEEPKPKKRLKRIQTTPVEDPIPDSKTLRRVEQKQKNLEEECSALSEPFFAIPTSKTQQLSRMEYFLFSRNKVTSAHNILKNPEWILFHYKTTNRRAGYFFYAKNLTLLPSLSDQSDVQSVSVPFDEGYLGLYYKEDDNKPLASQDLTLKEFFKAECPEAAILKFTSALKRERIPTWLECFIEELISKDECKPSKPRNTGTRIIIPYGGIRPVLSESTKLSTSVLVNKAAQIPSPLSFGNIDFNSFGYLSGIVTQDGQKYPDQLYFKEKDIGGTFRDFLKLLFRDDYIPKKNIRFSRGGNTNFLLLKPDFKHEATAVSRLMIETLFGNENWFKALEASSAKLSATEKSYLIAQLHQVNLGADGRNKKGNASKSTTRLAQMPEEQITISQASSGSSSSASSSSSSTKKPESAFKPLQAVVNNESFQSLTPFMPVVQTTNLSATSSLDSSASSSSSNNESSQSLTPFIPVVQSTNLSATSSSDSSSSSSSSSSAFFHSPVQLPLAQAQNSRGASSSYASTILRLPSLKKLKSLYGYGNTLDDDDDLLPQHDPSILNALTPPLKPSNPDETTASNFDSLSLSSAEAESIAAAHRTSSLLSSDHFAMAENLGHMTDVGDLPYEFDANQTFTR